MNVLLALVRFVDMKTVYTKDACPACVTLKASLVKSGEAFQEIKIGRDITREAFMEKFPTVRTVPYMIDNSDKGD